MSKSILQLDVNEEILKNNKDLLNIKQQLICKFSQNISINNEKITKGWLKKFQSTNVYDEYLDTSF